MSCQQNQGIHHGVCFRVILWKNQRKNFDSGRASPGADLSVYVLYWIFTGQTSCSVEAFQARNDILLLQTLTVSGFAFQVANAVLLIYT